MAEEYGMPEHGIFCWTEIIANDVDACKSFYSNVFGWEFNQSKATGKEMQYFEYNLPGSYPQGGLFKMTPEMCGGGEVPPPHLMNYIAVDDCDASAAKAAELGGKVVFGPSDIPNVGRFAMIEDPAGATVSLLKLNQM